MILRTTLRQPFRSVVTTSIANIRSYLSIFRSMDTAILSNSVERYLKNTERSCQSAVNGMELGEIVKRLENYAPLSLAESWDNVGLLVEPSTASHLVKSILLTNDLTEAVMDEAIKKDANMILSYHPPIFTPLKTLTRSTWKERVVLKAVENKIAIYSPHTAFDSVKDGVNDWLASGLGKGTVRPLKNTFLERTLGVHKVNIVVSKDDQSKVDELVSKVKEIDENIVIHVGENLCDMGVSLKCNVGSLMQVMKLLKNEFPEMLESTDVFSLAKVPLEDTGIGRLCVLEEAVSVETLVQRVKDHLKLGNIRFALASQRSQTDLITTVAICAGSGGSVVKGVKADLYLTGEMSHHDVLDAVSNGIHVVLGEHSNTERGFFKRFSRLLYDMLDGQVTVHQSVVDADPITIA